MQTPTSSARQILSSCLPLPLKQAARRVYDGWADRIFQPYLKRKNVEGVEFDFWIGDRDGRDWYDRDATDPVWPEMRFLRDHFVREGNVIFECGGHHGCTAVFLSHCVGPGGRIITFEASPANCDIIERNLRQNGLTNVQLERKAVGATAGRIHITGASNAAVEISGQGREVEMVPLDEFASLTPSLLKIDVEGFEIEVLRGASRILATLPRLAIEVHVSQLAAFGSSAATLFELINARAYRWWIQYGDVDEPTPYDPGKPLTDRCHLFGLPLEGKFALGFAPA